MTLKLEYLKRSKEKNAWLLPDGRMWTILVHTNIQGADYYRSTRSLQGLKELGLIQSQRGY